MYKSEFPVLLANYQLALTGQLSLDAFPNKILTDGQLTER